MLRALARCLTRIQPTPSPRDRGRQALRPTVGHAPRAASTICPFSASLRDIRQPAAPARSPTPTHFVELGGVVDAIISVKRRVPPGPRATARSPAGTCRGAHRRQPGGSGRGRKSATECKKPRDFAVVGRVAKYRQAEGRLGHEHVALSAARTACRSGRAGACSRPRRRPGCLGIPSRSARSRAHARPGPASPIRRRSRARSP